MLATPAARPSVGVKVAVRVWPMPLIAPSVPLATAISPSMKLASGSSLKLKVMVAVWPILSAALLLVMATVGASVSTLRPGLTPAPPRLRA